MILRKDPRVGPFGHHKQLDDVFDRSGLFGHCDRHRGRNLQRLVDRRKIIVLKVNGGRVDVVA